jgi:hypothetical protein
VLREVGSITGPEPRDLRVVHELFTLSGTFGTCSTIETSVDSQISRWRLALAFALAVPSCGKSTNMAADTPTGSATAGAVPNVAIGHGLSTAPFAPGRYVTAIQRTMHGTHALQVLNEDSTSAFALDLAADGTATACRGWRYVFRNDGPEVHTEDHYREQQGYRGRYTVIDVVAEVEFAVDNAVCPHIFEGGLALVRYVHRHHRDRDHGRSGQDRVQGRGGRDQPGSQGPGVGGGGQVECKKWGTVRSVPIIRTVGWKRVRAQIPA